MSPDHGDEIERAYLRGFEEGWAAALAGPGADRLDVDRSRTHPVTVAPPRRGLMKRHREDAEEIAAEYAALSRSETT